MVKEYIPYLDGDTAEVKAGKEVLNQAFNQMSVEAQKSLNEYAERLKNDSTKVKALEDSLADFVKRSENELKDKDTQIGELKTALEHLNRSKVVEEEKQRKSFSDRITEALDGKGDEVRNFLSNKNAGLQYGLKAVGNMGVVANAVAPQFAPIVGPAHEMVHARDFIPVSPTNSNLIRYVQFTAKDGSIQTVAINTLKSQIDYTETVVDAPVVKIAGWINVADEFLEDIVGATSWLSAELPMALYDAEDAQIFKGNGTTNNIAGLYTNATALTFPYAGVLGTANNIDKLLAASTYVRRRRRVATAAWTSPEDYLNILINKGTTQEYTYPIMFNSNTGMLMLGDLPVIQHTVFQPGEGFVGDFTRGARIFQKADATLRFSTENQDNFVKNVTTVLVEERIALANFYPDSFVKVTLNGTYSG